jgi:ribosomal protein L40E
MLKTDLEQSSFYLNKSIIYLSNLIFLINSDNPNYSNLLEKFEYNYNSFIKIFEKNTDLFKIVFFKEINNEEILNLFENIIKYKELSLLISNSEKSDILVSLNDLLTNLSFLLNYLNNILHSLPANELKSWELIVLNSFLDKLDPSHSNYIALLLNDLKEYYEVFLKIRGDLLGQDLKENTLKIISFTKEVTDSLEDKTILSKANNYTRQIKEIDEYIKEVDTKISDYEYYIISKDVSLTRIPFANIWFEFILYSYWLYENNISLNTLKNLYEYRTKNSFDNTFKWYEIYITRIFNKESIKNELYKNINQKLNEIKDFISSLYLQIVNNYPNKVEILNSWANLFYDILSCMDKLEKEIHITYNSKELKGSGIFENLYDIIYKVYSEDLPIVSLYNFYSYLNDIVNDLQKNEDSLLTPYDKLVLDNIDLFNEFLVTINNYFLDYENKDLLVDIWLYFDSKVKPILLNIINDYKDIEKIFEAKKIVCFKCGFENEYYNEYCVKCNSKLIKPKIESQSTIKMVFNQFKENYLSNSDYSKFLYAFINLINNSVINFENVYKRLENLPKEGEVVVLLEKVENILGTLTDIKNNLSLFGDLANNNEKKELIETIEINIEELEKLLNDFNNYITNLQTNIRSF